MLILKGLAEVVLGRRRNGRARYGESCFRLVRLRDGWGRVKCESGVVCCGRGGLCRS